MINSIILGGNVSIRDFDSTENKALLQIKNKPMIEYVIDALNEVKEINKIVLVGELNQYQYLHNRVDHIIKSSETLIDNILNAYHYLGKDSDLLICSSDIPLITPSAIEDLILKSQKLNADATYPIVRKSVIESAYPEMRRSYFKLKDGTFTAGNMYYVKPRALDQGIAIVENIFKHRKNPIKMARVVSLRLMFDLILGNLTIDKVEHRIYKMTKLQGKAVISDFPEMGCDVDKASDIIATNLYCLAVKTGNTERN